MRTLIICKSYHHKNTEKVADVIAKVLHADVLAPGEVDFKVLEGYDLIGFGSGIYFGKHHKELLDLADRLPNGAGKKAFIFSTSGRIGAMVPAFHRILREKLKSKEFEIVGEFNSPGFDTFGPFRLIGGLQKGHPNEEDLRKADEFAQGLARKTKG